MDDPRIEASDALQNVRVDAANLLKTVGSIGRLTAYSFNKLLAMRRRQFIGNVDRERGAQVNRKKSSK